MKEPPNTAMDLSPAGRSRVPLGAGHGHVSHTTDTMFTLEQLVPCGRSFDEYRAMFALSDADLEGRVLGCGDGRASFNAVATRRGANVASCDPNYRWGAADNQARIEDTYAEMMEQTRRNRDELVWDAIPSVDGLGLPCSRRRLLRF